MNFIGATRSIFFLGMLAGGPLAMWSMQIVAIVLMCSECRSARAGSAYPETDHRCLGSPVTAAVLAEVCSAIPLSGSIYIWASEAAGRKHGRLIGFIVAFWSSAAWMTFAARYVQLWLLCQAWTFG
jgi:translation initiation factor 5B